MDFLAPVPKVWDGSVFIGDCRRTNILFSLREVEGCKSFV